MSRDAGSRGQQAGPGRAPLAYRWLLRLLPASLRRDFGDEMQELMALRLREAGTRGRLRAWWLGLCDIVAVAATDRFGGSARGPVLRPRRDDGGRGGVMSGIGFDLRYALRTLLRTPTYTLATIVTLGVGIGAVTALFTVVNGVLLSPLPYRDADRLTLVNSPLLTADNVSDWVQELQVAGASAMFTIGSGTATTAEGAARVRVMPIGRGLLELIGWRTMEGRTFTESDHEADAAPVALVSERFWRERFGITPAAGHTLRIDDRAYDVVGVLPHDELLVYRSLDVWIPFESATGNRGSLLVRLPEGMSVDAARERLQPFADRLVTPDFTKRYEGMRVTTLSMQRIDDIMLGDVRRTLWLLFAASGLVLLLSALNVANLATGRAQTRSGELALRAALGAGRLRLVRQLTVEALLIAAGGVTFGLLLAGLTPALLALAPDFLPRVGNIRLDSRVLAWAIAVTLGAVLVFGVLPAWWMAARSERTSLHAAVERPRHGIRAQSTLVVVEIAVALVLVVGVALLVQTYATLRPTAPGFRIDDVAVASFSLPRPTYDDPSATRRFAEDLVASLERSTGARAAVATDLPLTGVTA
ncbi:MAG TPA: ABC transporter permease, partial [Longimicrobiales bacterium]|nr:ABC transporter permease [Longimicrobiales bacterium]